MLRPPGHSSLQALAAILLAIAAVAALGGCGTDSSGATSVEAASPADGRLATAVQDELGIYEDGFDLEVLPAEQQAQLAPIVDNLPQAAGGVRVLRVSGGVVEAETDFRDDEQGAETGRLICGAIERAVGPTDPGGHRVLGLDGAVLADCGSDDVNFP